jgi:hypothetical protein
MNGLFSNEKKKKKTAMREALGFAAVAGSAPLICP